MTSEKSPSSRPKKSTRSQKRRRRSRKPKIKLHVPTVERVTLETRLVAGVFPIFGHTETNTLDVLPIFRPQDFKVITETSNYWLAWNPIDVTYPKYATFQVSVDGAIERLELLGVTIESATTAFNDEKANEIAEHVWFHDSRGSNPEREPVDSRYKILKGLSIEAWQNEFTTLFRRNVSEFSDLHKFASRDRPILRTLIEDMRSPFGFPCSDQRYMLRLALDVLPPDEILILHCFISPYADGAAIYAQIEEALIGDAGRFEKTIVLTEGTTDAEILNQAIRVLRPNLSPYFHFMQFDEYKVSGGAGQLVIVVKAFAASGIRNKIVALFDNDTAGHEQLETLRKRNLADNFRAIALPDIELAKNYPTIGPNGPQKMNINRQAASIELYFGEESLADENNELCNVQWTGFNRRMGRYQGEILGKKEVQKRIKETLKQIEKSQLSPHRLKNSGFHPIFDALVQAYH